MFKNPFSFSGRIRRLEFGLSYLAYFIVALSMESMLGPEDAETSARISAIYLIILLPMMWILLAQGVKRCHDRGNTGWFIIIPFYIFWLVFADGEPGVNRFGPNPKGIGNYDEIDHIGEHLSS